MVSLCTSPSWCNWTYQNICIHFGWQGLWKDVKNFVNTDDECQCFKITGIKYYGKYLHHWHYMIKCPINNIILNMWRWIVSFTQEATKHEQEQKFLLLTSFHVCTNWCKFAPLYEKTVFHVALKLDSIQLACTCNLK